MLAFVNHGYRHLVSGWLERGTPDTDSLFSFQQNDSEFNRAAELS